MILLSATRLTITDRFSYVIKRVGQATQFTSGDVSATVDELERLGVGNADALHFVAHARIWGSVEIIEGPDAWANPTRHD